MQYIYIYLHTANIPKEIFINCLFILLLPFSIYVYYSFHYMWLFWEIKTDSKLFVRFLKKCDILPHTVEITLSEALCLSVCCILFLSHYNESPRSLLPHTHTHTLLRIWPLAGWWLLMRVWSGLSTLAPSASHYVVARQQHSVAARDWWRPLNWWRDYFCRYIVFWSSCNPPVTVKIKKGKILKKWEECKHPRSHTITTSEQN